MPKALKASLAFVNIPSDNPMRSREFFQDLLGIDLVQSLSEQEGYHAPISEDGIDLDVNVRHSPNETTTAFFAVDDLDQAINLAQKSGGRIVWGPEELPIPQSARDEYKRAVKEIDNVEVRNDSMGRSAIVLDPGGSQVGLVELEEHAHRHFMVGKHKKPLDDHQVKVHERAMKIAAMRR